jgi:hypothetical protein
LARIADYGDAMAALSRYLRPRWQRSVLVFSTALNNGKFARTYMQVRRPNDLDPGHVFYDSQLHLAKKQHNMYDYDEGYLFVIESEYGIEECAATNDDDDGSTGA